MTEQVMVRCPQLHNNITVFKAAEVLSRNRGMVRVMVRGETRPREVEASETKPVQQVFNQPYINFGRPTTLPIRSYPESRGAVGFQGR